MNKQEAIEEINNLKGLTVLDKTINFDSEMVSKKEALNIVKQIDETVRPPEPKPLDIEKPVVPQYVADWYEDNKDDFEDKVYGLCVQFNFDESELNSDVAEWFGNSENKPIETLVKMKLFGYEVEKEKLYTVELPNPNCLGLYYVILRRDNKGKIYISSSVFDREIWRGEENAQLTESEIKQDFEWALQFKEEVKEC